MAKITKWDSPENETANNFISWGQVNDFVYGVLIGVRDVKSTLPDKAGELQKVYEILVRECSFHRLDDKKRVIEEPVVVGEGEIISMGGRKSIDSRMRQIKVGQVFGAKFDSEIPAKQKGFSATKSIKIFSPKTAEGEFEMDEKWLEEHKAENEVF